MTVTYKGTNLVGGNSFYADPKAPWPSDGPVKGTNYLFPTFAEVDLDIARGENFFRLVFSWEAFQPSAWKDPATNTGRYKTYYDDYMALLNYITGKGKVVMVDVHGGHDNTFGAYFQTKIGKSFNNIPVKDLFLNLWWNLARKLKDNPLVWFGITNEPVGIPETVWWPLAQELITKIRNEGFTGWIAMPGLYFTGAGTWAESNGKNWNLTDPLNKTAPQVHMYLDVNSGGNGTDIVSDGVGVTRLSNALNWCRSKGLKLVLGELGFSATNPIAKATWAKLDAYMEANGDAVLAWAWWARGPDSWWGGYQFTLCNTPTGRPQIDLLSPSFATSLAVPPPQVDPKDALIADLQARLERAAIDLAAVRTELAAVKAELAEMDTELKVAFDTLASIRALVI